MDQIIINNLEVFARHGVFPEEQRLGQKFLIDAVLKTNTRPAGSHDDLRQSIHYGEVAGWITDFVKKETYQLIETVAEKLAENLLLTIPNLNQVDLTVKKPWAPIGLPVEDVGVKITRGWHEVFIALGSNLGDSQRLLEEAVATLSAHPYIRVDQVSSWIKTAPYGVTEQPDFLNGCLRAHTLCQPHELLSILQEAELNAGRERLVHWGPRTLDLDLLLYDDLIMGDERLIIPHPEMQKRFFVLQPMTQIAPWKRHPVDKLTMRELLEQLEERCQE